MSQNPPVDNPTRIQAAINEVVWYSGPDPLKWPSVVFLGLAAKGITVKHLTKHRLDIAAFCCREEQKKRLTESRFGVEINEDYSKPVQGPGTCNQPSQSPTVDDVIHKLMRWREMRKHRVDNADSADANRFVSSYKELSMTKTALQMRESEVRAAFAALGVENITDTKKWPLKRLNQKVADKEAFSTFLQSKDVRQGAKPEGVDMDVLKNISDTLAEGGDVEVVSSKHETNGHAEESTMSTATATRKKSTPKHRQPAEGKPESRKGSMMGIAIEIMSKNKKKHWKTKELWEEIEKRGFKSTGQTPWSTLSAAIYKEIEDKQGDSRFVKVGPGMFGLNI